MGQLNATRREYWQSYEKHYDLYQKTEKAASPKSRRLLLFYSVECGLKSLILKNIGKNTFQDLKKYSENKNNKLHGHDVKAMTEELGIVKKYTLKRIRLKNSGGYALPEQYNQLWRYGVGVEDEREEDREEKTLQKLAEYIAIH